MDAPENTMVAFEAAVELGADVLETDIHGTADGVLMAYHDDSVERTTDGEGLLREMTLAQIKELDAGYQWTPDDGESYPQRGKGLTVPTLEALFEAFPGMRFNIDIKQQAPSIVRPFAEMIRKYGKENEVLVGSFYNDVINAFRKEIPEVATAGGAAETRNFYLLSKVYLESMARPQAQAFQVPEYDGTGLRVVTERFITAAHKRGIEVHVWTVNDPDEMRRLIEIGVDGIFTDYTSRLLRVLEEMGRD